MDGTRVRGRLRTCPRVFACAAELWAYCLWRLNPMCSIVFSDYSHCLERRKHPEKGSVFLGSYGVRLWNVALRPGSLDLLRSLSASGGAESVCRCHILFLHVVPVVAGLGGEAPVSRDRNAP